MQRGPLGFDDPELERAYEGAEVARYTTRQTVLGFFATSSVWVVIALYDRVVLDARGALPVLHLANIPFLLFCAYLIGMHGRRLAKSVVQWFPVVVAFGPGLAVVSSPLVDRSFLWSEGPMLAIYIVCVHSYMALRFVPATLIGGTLIAASFVALAIVGASGVVFFQEGIFVLTSQLMGMQVSYRTERYRRRDFRQARALRAEQEKSERLLHNMLPPAIAERLKRDPRTIADHVDAATVLFADIVGFTGLSEQMAPVAIVELLNEVFTAFDRLTQARGLEKIKTIGDAYMVAGGLTGGGDDARAVAELALDLRAALPAVSNGRDLEMRIGIHTGPVVAGVIGQSKLVYDLWGDTVNVASRMESHGQRGAIQLSDATRRALGDAFTIEERGTIDVKGKGPMRTYWLVGRARAAGVW